ncbi:MAG: hypothetical protein ACK4QP_10395 [Pseudorhizobium sp.]
MTLIFQVLMQLDVRESQQIINRLTILTGVYFDAFALAFEVHDDRQCLGFVLPPGAFCQGQGLGLFQFGCAASSLYRSPQQAFGIGTYFVLAAVWRPQG